VTCPVALWPVTSEADTVRFNMINPKINNRIRMQTNALNACLAVLRFKQLRGFYCEDITYYHLLCEVGDLKIVGASDSDEIELCRVRYMPKELESGVLYVSEEFGAAAHPCACGCGSKIRTPLGPPEWALEETDGGPSLSPSVGNWQQPCQSHYWIRRGEVRWAGKWTPEQIAAGRRGEEERRRNYYDALDRKRGGPLHRMWRWMKDLFRR